MGVGLEVAVVGVAVVFTFLAALVLSVHALGWFFRRFGHRFPEPPARTGGGSGRREPATAQIAAILASIEAHRARGGR